MYCMSQDEKLDTDKGIYKMILEKCVRSSDVVHVGREMGT